jgi:hypothetical protein
MGMKLTNDFLPSIWTLIDAEFSQMVSSCHLNGDQCCSSFHFALANDRFFLRFSVILMLV